MKQLTSSILLVCMILSVSSSHAQDTTWVQTLTFDDGIYNLRQTFKFPSKDKTYNKVLGFMTLKCDKGLISNPTGSGCGEWDAGADLKIYHHTGEYDSTYKKHGRYQINGTYPQEFEYNNGPLYNYYERYEKNRTVDAINAETVITIDDGNHAIPLTHQSGMADIFLWRADELKAAGLKAGTIDQIAFKTDLTTPQDVKMKIAYKLVGATVIQQATRDGFTEVYTDKTTLAPSSFHTLTLHQPIEWNGTSNLALQIELIEQETPISVSADQTSYNAAAVTQTNDGFLELNGEEYVVVDMNNYKFEDEITISFWAHGDPDHLPTQTTLFSCSDALGNRVMSGYVPQNSNIRWDSGEKGNTDRIIKAASNAQIAGSWHHWAFTKNIQTGETKIYLNGKIFHKETSDFLPIGPINRLLIGIDQWNENLIRHPYFGKIDDFSMWKKALSEQVIKDWMHRSIDERHPNDDDLVLHYNFNEPYHIEDHSGNGFTGMSTHASVHKRFTPKDAFKTLVGRKEHPDVQFFQGDYTFTKDSILTTDSSLVEPTQLIEYGLDGKRFAVAKQQNIWTAQKTYTYDHEGNVKATVDHNTTSKISKDSVEYYEGPFEVTIPWTIAKYITPYGNNLNLGEGFTWVWDVTEFEQYLKDSVDLQAGSVRELIDLKFMMVEGPAPASLKISRIWENELNKYWMMAEDSTRKPVDVAIDPATKHLFLRSSLGGHGHASDNGEYPHCCEWLDNEHFMYANGKQVDAWRIWKNCGTTALYPQGGTWPGARAGWCPGDVRDRHYTRLTEYVKADNTINLDYRITPVPEDNQKMGNGNYSNDGWYVMQYGDPVFDHDAELLRIINPSDWDIYKRLNPICDNAQVIIRNNGDLPLTELTFTYGVRGGEDLTYQWTGNLLFKEVDTVSLPVTNGAFYEGDGSNTFVVRISKPNGADDEYQPNNVHTSHYELPDMYEGRVKIVLRTNKAPHQNSYYVTNALGYRIFERTNLDANTTYEDEINTYGGCYTFHFDDEGNDGLSYWANTTAGTGSLSIRDAENNRMLKNFNPDFGSGIHYSFAIGSMTYVKEPNLDDLMDVYPNPAKDLIHVQVSGHQGNARLLLFNAVGQTVYSRNLQASETEIQIPVEHLEPGIYTAKWIFEGNSFARKVMLVR